MSGSKYRKKYCNEIIEHMKEGRSKNSFCAKIGVQRATFYAWIKQYPEFQKAVEIANEQSEVAWEDKGMQLAERHPSIYIFQMKARFGWKEPQHHEHSGPNGGPIKTEEKTTLDVTNMSDEQLKEAIDKKMKEKN